MASLSEQEQEMLWGSKGRGWRGAVQLTTDLLSCRGEPMDDGSAQHPHHQPHAAVQPGLVHQGTVQQPTEQPQSTHT